MPSIAAFFRRQRARLLIAAVITLLALILRVHMALTGPVEWDEPVYLNAAIRYAANIRAADLPALLHESYNLEHPILAKLAYGAVMALHNPVPGLDSRQMIAGSLIENSPYFLRFLSLRSVSVVFGALAVFLLTLLNPLAGLLLAVNTYAVKYTSVMYLEALPLALSIAGVSAYQHARGMSNQRSRWLALSAACLGAAVASKYIYALPALAVAADLSIQWLLAHLPKRLAASRAQSAAEPTKLSISLWPGYSPGPGPADPLQGGDAPGAGVASAPGIRAAALWGGLLLVSFLLANPVILADPVGRMRQSIAYNIRYAQSNEEVSRAGYPFWQPLSWLSISVPRQPTRIDPFFIEPGNYWLAIDEVMLPLALLGFWRLRQRSPVYAIWLLGGLIFLLAWNTKWPQYILVILPPFCLSAALGAQWLAQGLSGLWRGRRARIS